MKLTKRDLTTLHRTELLDLKQRLDGEIAEIKRQLDQVHIGRFQIGQYADRDWYLRTTHALRRRGLESQAVQNELARRKQERKANATTVESRFMEVARLRLTDDVFANILSEARERTKEEAC